MAVNKVIFGNVTLIDTSEVTVTPDKMFAGETALGANGEMQTGEFTIDAELTEQDALLTELETVLAGKAAGDGGSDGGSATYDMCTLNVSVSVQRLDYSLVFAYKTVENGKIIVKSASIVNHDTVSVPCMCGSMFVIEEGPWPASVSGLTLVADVSNVSIYSVDVDAGEAASFTIADGGAGA